MRMYSSIVACAALVAPFVVPLTFAQPLPTDPAIVPGVLDNGLKYIVRKHAKPEGRAVIWIHIHSGSLNETEPQRGLAHYLEHMAFNGSENFPPGSVVPLFQSLGMTFGRDQNAFTSFDQTTYQLSLPNTKPETLDKGFTFFSDVLTKLTLNPAEIDAERGIIQEERRRSLSGRQRTSYYVLERMAPGSLFGQRITIGTEQTIASVQQQDFKDYYSKWYTPSNATLMVVADAEPQEIIKIIHNKFGPAPSKPRPKPQDINVRAYDTSFAIVASDPEVRTEDVRIMRLEPARPPVTTVPQYRDELVATLGVMAANRRLDAKVAAGGTPYQGPRVSLGNDANAIYTAEISARASSGKWKEALEGIALELQRARAFGFTSREIDDAKKQMISGAERAVETESTAPASALISRMNSSVTSGEPIMSPQQRLDLLHKLLPSITSEDVAKRFASEFDFKHAAFVAVLPSGENVPSEAALLEIGTKALAVKPTPEAESTHATQLMSDLPKPGTVVEGAEHASSKVYSAWLSNNVRVHHRFMDERKNNVSVSITLYGGELTETADNRGITQAAQLAWSRPATQSLSSTDIRELMTGKKVNVRGGGGFGGGRGGRGGGGGFGGGPDSISLTISGSPDELETGFQLAYLLLTQPRIEEAQFSQFKENLARVLEESTKNPMMYGMRLAGSAPYPDSEPRTQPMTVEQLNRITLDAAQARLNALIAESPVEVSIVGDLPREKALELAAKYLGALPARAKVEPNMFANLRTIERPAGPRIIEKTIDTPTPQAFVYSGFYGADDSNRADARALSMAARILSTRMVKEVREDAQLVYSISAGSRAATTFPGFGTFSASAPTDPPKVAALMNKLASMYETFAKNGPTEDELTVAKKQMANTFEEQMKEPSFWSGRLDNLTFRNTNLDETLNEPAAFQALTAKQIQDTFAKYYHKDKSIVVVVKPKSPDTTK